MNPLVTKLIAGGIAAGVLGLGVASAATNAFAVSSSPKHTATTSAADKAGDKHADRRAIARVVFESEADVLGMKPEDLRKALKQGKTVEQLAAAKGMTKDQFADKLAAAVKPGLERLVDNKQITQAQADKVVDRIQHGYIPSWEGRHHKK